MKKLMLVFCAVLICAIGFTMAVKAESKSEPFNVYLNYFYNPGDQIGYFNLGTSTLPWEYLKITFQVDPSMKYYNLVIYLVPAVFSGQYQEIILETIQEPLAGRMYTVFADLTTLPSTSWKVMARIQPITMINPQSTYRLWGNIVYGHYVQ